ncbi:MAG: hypothetical protein WCL44_09790 [bacterium]
MSARRTRYLVATVLALFLCVIAWWVLYLPYESGAVLRAIPANVAFVSVHDNVAERWGDIAGSRLVRCMAFSTGAKAEDYDKAVTNSETIKWIAKFAGKRVAIAYTPSLNGSGQEAWLVSSWIGGYSQRLRWMASLGLIPDAKPVGMCGRQRLWTVPVDDLPGGKVLSIAVSEGVLMCCISALPQGVGSMVEAFEGSGRIQAGISESRLSQEAAILSECSAPDRGWIAYGSEISPFSFQIDSLAGDNSSGRIRVRNFMPADTVPLKTGGLDNLGRLLGDVPEIVAVCRSRFATALLDLPWLREESGPVADVVKNMTADKGDRRMFMCLLGGRNRAAMKSLLPEGLGDLVGGMLVPVVMMGVEVDDAEAARLGASGLLDRLNTDYQLGIIKRSIPVGDETVMSIEGTGKGMYSNFRAEERVAYTVCGGWLIVSSNVEALSKLLVRYQAGPSGAKDARWLKGLLESDNAINYAWADLDAAGVTLKDSLALWKLSMSSGQSTSGRKTRRMLNFAMDWMDAIRPLGQGTVSATPDGIVTEFRFALGE